MRRPHEKLAALLKKARIDAGIEQSAAAQELGVTHSAFSRIESGESVKFPVLYFVRLCDLYNVPFHRMLEWLNLFSKGAV